MDNYSEIEQAITNDNLELARNLLRLRIEETPESADVWYYAAQAAVNESQREHFLEKAVALDPLHHRAANQLHQLRHPQPVVSVMPEPVAVATQEAENYDYADFSQRVFAFTIDFIIVSGVFLFIFFLISSVLSTNSSVETQSTLAMLVLIILQPLYFAYFLSKNEGQTPGKRLIGIRVVKRDNSAIYVVDALLRSVIGYALSALIFGAGFFWMLNHHQKQTWHDMVADTIVIQA